MADYGRSRDSRRRLTTSEARELYVRAGGRCQRAGCGELLPVDWHASHLVAWTNGGATTVEQMQAWCRDCNLRLGPNDAIEQLPVELRIWQEQALPEILRSLFEHGFATLHAAPGAGKTLFAGVVFRHLRELDLVDRLVVVVPNRALVQQWSDALGNVLRLHLDPTPRDGCFEHPQTDGAVITYQRLSEPSCAEANRIRAGQLRTLVVFDEVHHLGLHGSWHRGAERFVGSTERGEDGASQLHGLVLNMTGTLFRSSGNRRIATVGYRPVAAEAETRYEALADYSVRTVDLVGSQLRPIDLWVYGSTVEVVDLREQTVISSGVADLDERVRATAMRGMLSDSDWLRAFSAHALALLRQRAEAIEHAEPLKLLFVADDQRSAKRAADAINDVARADFARLVISDEPRALRVLRSAARDPRPLAIVAVQMVTEGFDCPQLATIAYATRTTTEMFIAQMMARAMRITEAERQMQRVLPAAVLIPDRPQLRQAFVKAMVGYMHLLEEIDPAIEEPRLQAGEREPLMPAFQFVGADAPALDTIMLPGENEEVSADELDQALTQVLRFNIPTVYAPRVAVITRLNARNTVLRRYDPEAEAATATSTVVEREAHPRQLNEIWRGRLSRAVGWWTYNCRGHREYATPQHFNAAANRAAGIRGGSRPDATPEQLERAFSWMQDQVRRECRTRGMPIPKWAEE